MPNQDLTSTRALSDLAVGEAAVVCALDGGSGLGMMWGQEKAVDMIKAAGFKNVQVHEIPEDPFNLHFLCYA